jgi:hypothetical protein
MVAMLVAAMQMLLLDAILFLDVLACGFLLQRFTC